jgi:hypothetical protein
MLMSQRRTFRIRLALLIALGLPGFIGTIALVLWANDEHQDRKHTITAEGPTPIFGGNGQSCDTRERIAVVEQGAVFTVRRIRYWKDCATLDVNLPDGRWSHFFQGVGHFAVQPPLP